MKKVIALSLLAALSTASIAQAGGGGSTGFSRFVAGKFLRSEGGFDGLEAPVLLGGAPSSRMGEKPES